MEDDSMFKVYLRLRNSKNPTKGGGGGDVIDEDIYSIDVEDPGTLVAAAPDTSETHKNSVRNHTLSVQKFKFSRIFPPSTQQADLFESTALPLLEEVLNLENNALLFTYGVTNSGKTHTVQGPRDDAGLLPRSLDLIFNTLGSNIKPKSMFSPHLYNDVSKMTEKLQQQREQLKQRIIYPDNVTQDLEITGMTDPNSTRCTVGTASSMTSDSTIAGDQNGSYQITDNVTVQLTNAENVQYSVWVSYIELYNENIYDLLQPPSEQGGTKPAERLTLRLGDDHNMSVYVRGVTQLEVCSFAEANRALAYGQKNRKRAATLMNQSSSRSHAIFKITIIATNTLSQQSNSSQITFVDLAGSERYGKTNAAGVRLKEAGNINTSLLTLGKCISSLKHNSRMRSKQGGGSLIVPFRESKLTRLFKNFLSGEGLMSMIVCVNPHQDFFDESIHALKFSALATEALLLPRAMPQSRITATATPTVLTESMRAALTEQERFDIRAEVLAGCNERIRLIRERHEIECQDIVDRETVYWEGKEEALQTYYASTIERLKKKIIEARNRASADEGMATELEEVKKENEELSQQCKSLEEQLEKYREEGRGSLAAHKKTKDELEEKLFQSKLELRTTQKMINDVVKEKDRLAEVVTEKDQELKRMFSAIEEATKLATFWEKEYNDLKSSKHDEVDEGADLRGKLITVQEQVMEKNKVISQLQEELGEIVRSKSLQFDALICKKEAECDELKGLLTAKEEEIAELLMKHQTGEQPAAPEMNEDKVEKLRLQHELARQEADRVKVELAAANRKLADTETKYKDAIAAKDIEIQNWYDEKEKAVKLISSKKEKKIAELEDDIQVKVEKIRCLEEQIDTNPPPPPPQATAPLTAEQVYNSPEYMSLMDECKDKLDQMADMAIEKEQERDAIQKEYTDFKTQINTAISKKEVEFKSLRAELAASQSAVRDLEEKVGRAETRATELEVQLTQCREEMECVARKTVQKQVLSDSMNQSSVSETVLSPVRRSTRLQNMKENSKRLTQTSRSSTRSITRTSTLSHSSSRSTKSRRSSSISGGNKNKRPAVKTSTRRTSQILINKSLNTTRSTRSRVVKIEESPGSDAFNTPDATGVKRKATLKGIKDMLISSSPRLAKKGKRGAVEVSDSDSDFLTPTQQPTKPRQGKRKLHKSHIGSPELITVIPDRPGLRDVVPDSPATDTKMTRSRAKMIQQHLSAHTEKKTKSRNTRI